MITIKQYKINVTPAAEGTGSLGVSSKESVNYTPPPHIDVNLKVEVPKTLNAATPAEIKAAVEAGTAPSLWAVGDQVPIPMSGRVGILDINDTYYAKLIGLNHNKERESNGKPNAHFKIPYTADGKQLSFCDSLYGSNVAQNADGMCMNPTDTYNSYGGNKGGWTGSYAYKTLIPQWLAALPAIWQTVITNCTKYTDNVGNGSNVASNVTANSQKVFYLAEFEVFGRRSYANNAELNYQQQYAYYNNGGGKIHYRHDQQDVAVYIWPRSPICANANSFCMVGSGGGTSHDTACYSWGGAAAFQIS